MIYKTESDFDNIIQYNKFCNEQSNITFDKIEKGIEECNKNNIEIIDYEIDEYDYPCVYLKINLNEWNIMKITANELLEDIYRLGSEEGYFSCLCEYNEIINDDEEEYYLNILDIVEKYIPNYEKYMPPNFFNKETSFEEKGQMLSDLGIENFKQIINGIIIKNGEKNDNR